MENFFRTKGCAFGSKFSCQPTWGDHSEWKKTFSGESDDHQKSYSHFKIWIQNFTKTKNLICDMYYDVEYASQNYRNPKNIESVICFQLLKYCYD